MKIEIRRKEKMSVNGDSVIRAIHNLKLPIVDILVRESIQNSLDASVDGSDHPVLVDYMIGDFELYKATEIFEGIENELLKRFKGMKTEFLSIRDLNTTGLNGPLTYKDGSEGNFLKLVYDFGNAQIRKDAGGSWGQGKSIYYNVGIGLVIYYTATVNDDGEHEERLAAVLVERTKDNDARLLAPAESNVLNTGIAFWGEEDDESSTKPLTDHDKIKEILGIFGVEGYRKDQTGTTVIIPFIDCEDLFLNKVKGTDEEELFRRVFPGMEEYIWNSVQKWYFPRIYNLQYGWGNHLEISINGIRKEKSDMRRVFRVYQDMYNFASMGRLAHFEEVQRSEFEVRQIKYNSQKYEIRSTDKEKDKAGEFVYLQMNYEELGYGFPNAPLNPYNLVGRYSDYSEHSPLIMYCRKPGMIINYASFNEDSDWLKGLSGSMPEIDGEYIFGIFVLNSDAFVRPYGSKSKGIRLEEYIRSSEGNDHFSWNDTKLEDRTIPMVSDIKRRVREALKNNFSDKKTTRSISYAEKMSRYFGSMIMPASEYGKGTSVIQTGSQGGRSELTTHHEKGFLVVESDECIFQEEGITIPFNIIIGKRNLSGFKFSVSIGLESRNMPLDRYEKDLAQNSGISISGIRIMNTKNFKEYTYPRNGIFHEEKTSFGSVYSITADYTFEEMSEWKCELSINSEEKTVVLGFSVDGVK